MVANTRAAPEIRPTTAAIQCGPRWTTPGGVHPAAVDAGDDAQRPQGPLGPSLLRVRWNTQVRLKDTVAGERRPTGQDQRGRAATRPGRAGPGTRGRSDSSSGMRKTAATALTARSTRSLVENWASSDPVRGGGADAHGDGAVGEREHLEADQAPERHPQPAADDPGEQDQQRHAEEVRPRRAG